MMYPSFADHQIDDGLLARVSAAYVPYQGPDGASLVRPLYARAAPKRLSV
jgi:hypothetical protein